MTEAQGNGALLDEGLQREAFGVFTLLKDQLAALGHILTEDSEERLVIDALTRHEGHLAVIIVQQNKLDPFKLACWLGDALIRSIPETKTKERTSALDGLINTLETLLYFETGEAVFVNDEDRTLLHRMLAEELSGNGEHGIGFNGLYVAFHFSCATVKDLNSRNLIKKPVPNALPIKAKTEKVYPEDAQR